MRSIVGVLLILATPPAPNVFDTWLRADFPPADGFSASTVDGPEARAIAHGRVAFVGECPAPVGRTVVLDHVYYDNHERLSLRSIYAGLLSARVGAGDLVRRGQLLGVTDVLSPRLSRATAAPYRCDDRAEVPESFIAAHSSLVVPQEEAALLLVSTEHRRMRVVLHGKTLGEYEVGFGQRPGRKRRQGDLRTPLGAYFVIQKSRGPFSGAYGDYYGGYWIKVNYPNAADAAWGRDEGLLDDAAARRIAESWHARKATWQGSPLGGGIGLHGWIDDWDLEGPRRLSWGCVVLRNADMRAVYDRIPATALVVIF